MSTTPNFLIDHISASQNQKEVTANSAFDLLEGAVSNLLSKALPSDANYTLTANEGGEALGNFAVKITGTITADRNIILPTNKKVYAVQNATTGGFNLVFKTSSGTGVTLAVDTTKYTMLYCDGTNVVTLTSFVGKQRFRVGVYAPGVASNAQSLYSNEFADNVDFPAGATGWVGRAKVAATASTVYTFSKNGTPFCTATFAIGATTATFAQASDAAFTADTDVLDVDGPSTADATLSGVGFVMVGTW